VSTKNEFLYWLVFETGTANGHLTVDNVLCYTVCKFDGSDLTFWSIRYIDKLERIQRNGACFITGDYKSRHEGAVTNVLHSL
jgi:hypothetical protein